MGRIYISQVFELEGPPNQEFLEYKIWQDSLYVRLNCVTINRTFGMTLRYIEDVRYLSFFVIGPPSSL